MFLVCLKYPCAVESSSLKFRMIIISLFSFLSLPHKRVISLSEEHYKNYPSSYPVRYMCIEKKKTHTHWPGVVKDIAPRKLVPVE